MAQWAELHKISGSAMKDVIVQLWPTEPIPNSNFGLVRRLVDAVPRIDAVKRSMCIEGARMAFARVKMHWAKLDAKKLMTEGPPEARSIVGPSTILIMSWRGPTLWRSNVRRI